MKQGRKIALVTGGSRGLGRDMVLKLAEKNTGIIFTYHSRLDEALHVIDLVSAAGSKAVAIKLDSGDVKSFDPFFADVSKLLKSEFKTDHFDFLINNAGIGLNTPFATTTEEDFDRLMNIHFKGVYFLTQKALSFINDGGRIINVSTGLARFTIAGYSAYASMKGGVETFTRYLARELGERGIAVNSLAPGAIETDFGGGHVRDNQDINKFVSGMTALGRAGLPGDIGGVVAFLCSPESGWINGQRIEVSGGAAL